LSSSLQRVFSGFSAPLQMVSLRFVSEQINSKPCFVTELVRRSFSEGGCLSGYFNPFHPHKQKRARKNLRAAKKLKILSPYQAGTYKSHVPNFCRKFVKNAQVFG
jgi:hypothetical protein